MSWDCSAPPTYTPSPGILSQILGEEVLVFEGSMGAAKQCQRLLAERDLLTDSQREGTISFENSDESKIEQCIEMFGYTDV